MNDTDQEEIGFAGQLVTEYINLANSYTQDLSTSLVPGMQALFVAICVIWVILAGYRLIMALTSPSEIVKDTVFIFVAVVLLYGQGPGLINLIFTASLNIMGSAASIALTVGATGDAGNAADGFNGLVALVNGAETGILSVLHMSAAIAGNASVTNPLPILYALILVAPYFLAIIGYVSQVVVAIFRQVMIASVSPFLMLAYGFNWGRGMAMEAVKLMIGTFIVLFGATAAIGIMLYGVSRLKVGEGDTIQIASDLIQQPEYWMAVALGWAGTALLAEGTGIANSIANSSLSNTAAGIMTAGIAGSAYAAATKTKQAGQQAVQLAAATAAPGAYGAVRTAGGAINAVSDTIAKYRKPGIEK